MRVVESSCGGVAAGIPVGVPVGVPVTPVAVLAAVVVTVPVLVPVGILVLVPVSVIGGAVADKLAHVRLLDDGLPPVLKRKLGDCVGTRSQSPGTGWATVLDHTDHLIGTVGGTFLVEFNSIHNSEGAAIATLDPRS